jgi:hypothetical protein
MYKDKKGKYSLKKLKITLKAVKIFINKKRQTKV